MLFISLLLAAIPLAWASPPFLHHNNGPINLSPRAAPVPTLPGIPDNCPLYHKVVEGDICVTIAQKYGITLAQFYAWNPAVSNDCKAGFWQNYWYCVAPPATTTTSTVTPTATPTGCTAAIPMPTQAGSICQCKQWYLVQPGDTCWALQQKFGFSLEDFAKWNPTAGEDCWFIDVLHYVCVAA